MDRRWVSTQRHLDSKAGTQHTISDVEMNAGTALQADTVESASLLLASIPETTRYRFDITDAKKSVTSSSEGIYKRIRHRCLRGCGGDRLELNEVDWHEAWVKLHIWSPRHSGRTQSKGDSRHDASVKPVCR